LDTSRVGTGLDVELHVRLGPNKAAGNPLMMQPQVRSTRTQWKLVGCPRTF
jgi:hypothetical protein